MARRASYSEGAAFSVLSFGSVVVLGLISSVIVARVYGVEPIGEFAIALAPAATLATLSQLREQTALVRELAVLPPRAPRVTGLFAAVLTFSSGLTTIIAIPLGLVSWFVLSGPIGRDDLFLPALALIASYVVLENPCWNLDFVFASFRAGRQLFWARLVQAASYPCLAVAASDVFDKPVWGLVSAIPGSLLIVLVLRLVAVRSFMRFSVPRAEVAAGFKTLPDLVRYGAKVAAGPIADGLARQSTVWVLSMTVSVAAVGAFNRAWLLATRFMELNYRVLEMLFPTLVERRASGDTAGFDRASIDSIRYCIAGMLLPAAAGGGAAHGVMELFGRGFEPAADALAIVLATPALAAVASIQTIVLWTDDRLWLSTIMTSARAVATVGLTVAFAIDFGITGAAAAMLLAYALDVTVGFAVVRRHWSTAIRELWPVRGMLALGFAYGAGFVTSRVVDDALPGALGTAGALTAAVLAYGAVLVAAGGLIQRDRERIAALLRRAGRPTGDDQVAV